LSLANLKALRRIRARYFKTNEEDSEKFTAFLQTLSDAELETLSQELKAQPNLSFSSFEKCVTFQRQLARTCCTSRKSIAINTLSGSEGCSAPRKSGKIRQNPCTCTKENVPKT
jgi:hypothetical protein